MTTGAIQSARILEPEQFSTHTNEVVDLTGEACRFIPAWLSKLPNIERIIVSNNPYRQNIDFEKGFSREVVVESFGNNWEHPPENLDPQQIRCEIDFTSRAYLEQFTQSHELSL